MATLWVTPEDVISRWLGGGSPSVDSPILATLIEDAEDAVLEVYPRIQERIDSGLLPINRVKRVVAGVVIRAYKIASEYRNSFSETTGPFSQSGSFSEQTPRTISLTDEEIRTLAPNRVKQAFTVSMAPNSHPGRQSYRWLPQYEEFPPNGVLYD